MIKFRASDCQASELFQKSISFMMPRSFNQFLLLRKTASDEAAAAVKFSDCFARDQATSYPL